MIHKACLEVIPISRKMLNEKVTVRCAGMASSDVTGSCYLVECPTGEKILLDCGIYQSGNITEAYKINRRRFPFKPKEITAVIVSHLNADHFCLLPKFAAEGGSCPYYISDESVEFVRPILEDSARIMERDAKILSRKNSCVHKPVYSLADVAPALPHFRGCRERVMHRITDHVSFRLMPAGHIFGSCQVELYITLPSGTVKKICYSGDLGNSLFEQPFVEEYEPTVKCSMYIGETTYNDPKRSAKKCQRKKDLDLMEKTIREVCLENHGIVLIPTFAMQRTETMLYMLWKIFHEDESFRIPIVIDSPLAVKLLGCFSRSLTGEWKQRFDEMMEWKNINIIEDREESLACIANPAPKVVCSASGMLSQGRSVQYLKEILPRKNCCILTCGYMVEDSLGWKIKHRSEQKILTIDHKPCKCRCSVKSLDSFSSHAQYQQLIDTYVDEAERGCSLIWLVHGDQGKLNFKTALEKRISKICKTTRVVATNRDTVAHI